MVRHASMNARPALMHAIAGNAPPHHSVAHALIGVIEGEGIGPEIIAASLQVLDAVARALPFRYSLKYGGTIGLPAVQECGKPLSDEVCGLVSTIFDQAGAVLCGPGGGRFVYDLRSRFDLFCKFTPVIATRALDDTGVLRPEVRRNVDILLVRENTGGLYFGEWGQRPAGNGDTSAYHHVSYDRSSVERLLRVAFRTAEQRTGRLCLVVKRGGIPSISRLWIEVLETLGSGHAVETSVLDIDNAAYQIVSAPGNFDVVVSPNMLGDVLADVAALLLTSRGMSYSGNFGIEGRAVYQTGHGSAHDLAGTDTANPIGQILSLAMMLRESFGATVAADAIEKSVEDVLRAGWRTRDIAGPGTRTIGTGEMGLRIATAVERSLYQTASA
jgi:3-isopropylmalate dehydrogenase